MYLSMIRDLYDNSIMAYKTVSQQTVSLVLDTIRLAMIYFSKSRYIRLVWMSVLYWYLPLWYSS